MDIVTFLGSINKVSLVFFFIVLGFILYEVYLLKKEKKKDSKPFIPDFNDKIHVDIPQLKVEPQIKKTKKISKKVFVSLMAISFLGLSIFTFSVYIRKQSITTNTSAQTEVEFVKSQGIVIYNDQFQALTLYQIQQLKAGDKIIIGVGAIPGSDDIDFARIRVNSNDWNDAVTTNTFDNTRNVFYTDYIIASDSSGLKIEAQLHSKKDGWIGQ